jgi:hypothetical protein
MVTLPFRVRSFQKNKAVILSEAKDRAPRSRGLDGKTDGCVGQVLRFAQDDA